MDPVSPPQPPSVTPASRPSPPSSPRSPDPHGAETAPPADGSRAIAVERLLTYLNVTAALATIAGVGFYLHDAPARHRERLIQERELLSRSRDDLESYRKRVGTKQVGEFDDGDCSSDLSNNNPGEGCQDMDPEIAALPNSVVHGLAGSERLFYREDLSGIRVDSADLSAHAFEHTSLLRFQLNDTNLKRVRLDHVSAGAARLRDVDASSACLSDVFLNNAWLQGTSLEGSVLRDVDLSGSVVVDSDLSDATIESATGIDGLVVAFSSLRNAKVRLARTGPLQRCLPEESEYQARPASREITASITVPWSQINPTPQDLQQFRASARPRLRIGGAGPGRSGISFLAPPPSTRYVTLAYVDARGADIDLTAPRVPAQITFANICTDSATRIRPTPPAAALDCRWMGSAARADRSFTVPPLAATTEARKLVKVRPGSLSIVTERTEAKAFLVDLSRPRDAEWQRVLEGERRVGRD